VEMVEDLGHDAIEAHSGSAAIEILQSDARVDLMITDFSMPKMSGAEVITAARTLRPDLPIILASGYAELPSGVKLDVSRLSKPYKQADLAAQISALLARS
jgi:CheY-like chemotaxis protein